MKRMKWSRALLGATIIAGLLYALSDFRNQAEPTKEPKKITTEMISPAIVEKLILQVNTETASEKFLETFDIKSEYEVKLLGIHLGSAPLEWGTYYGEARISAGFPAGTIHVVRITSDTIEFAFDAPKLMHLYEKKVHVLSHGATWSDAAFHEQADAKAEEMLWKAACESDLLKSANESARVKYAAPFLDRYPGMKVVIHTTEPVKCERA